MSKAKRPNYHLSHTPEFKIWAGMIQRCTNPSKDHYERYGGRGITVYEGWIRDFPAFLAHVGLRPTEKHTIDRIDNDRGYEPSNVRWATKSEQRKNMPDNIWVEYRGEKRLMLDVCNELGIPYMKAYKRRRRGWPDSELFN